MAVKTMTDTVCSHVHAFFLQKMAEKGDGKKYVCTLSDELIRKAEKELNEKPEWRDRDIQALRDMVLKNPALKCPTDDAFLLRFLRARKFDYERAYQLLINYYSIRAENPDVFKDMKPSAVKHILEAGVTTLLPKKNKDGQAVVYFRPGLWDPEVCPIYDLLRTNVMIFEKMIQDEETQINGMVLVGDFKEVGLTHARNLDRTYARLMSSVLQDSFPCRFKGMHAIHEPSIFGYIFAIIKPFLKEKLASRMCFHGWNEESLHTALGKDILPENCGGAAGPLDSKTFAEKMLTYDDEYEAMQKFGITLSSVQKYTGQDAMECLAGTYKKLNVD